MKKSKACEVCGAQHKLARKNGITLCERCVRCLHQVLIVDKKAEAGREDKHGA